MVENDPIRVPFLEYVKSYRTVANVLVMDQKERDSWETLVKSTLIQAMPHLGKIADSTGVSLPECLAKIVVLKIIERAGR